MISLWWSLLSIPALVLYVTWQIRRMRNRKTTHKPMLHAETIQKTHHHWNESLDYVRYSCTTCGKLGGGMFGKGPMQCMICGVYRHRTCASNQALPCKSCTSNLPISEFPHQWSTAITAAKACDSCGKRCKTADTTVLRCLWCQRVVHRQCSQNIETVCDFGPLKEGIIAPSEMSVRKKNSGEQSANRRDFELDFHFKNPNKTPIIAIVNKRSGGKLGEKVLSMFYDCLNPIQVIDLIDDGLERLKYFKRKVPSIRVIIGGGDGTVGGVMDYIRDELQDGNTLSNYKVPVALLPLGTGNDFSRALGWGSGTSNPNVRQQILDVIYNSEEVYVDRWFVKIDRFVNDMPMPTLEKTINNYVGVGVDAKVTLTFHHFREAYPNFCSSLFWNKVIYGVLGVLDALVGDTRHIYSIVNVSCEGKKIALKKVKGVLVQNVLTWSGGVRELFGETARMKRAMKAGAILNGEIDSSKYKHEDNFKRQSMTDGLIEGISLGSMLHIGGLQLGMRDGWPICQGSQIVIECTRPGIFVPVQTDGEPFACEAPFRITVDRCQKTLVLGLRGEIKTTKDYPFVKNTIKTPNALLLNEDPE